VLQRSDVRSSCPGVDRVLWLRVRVRDGHPSDGVVHGVRHRHPVEVTVSADAVRRLLTQGVPAIAVDGNGALTPC
jgi:hypothetical protein